MANYKSGDIVGINQTGHFVKDSIFTPQRFVPETYTWRIRYIDKYKIWILTATSSLDVFHGHEIVQSATDLNQWQAYLYPEFLSSNYVKLLAGNTELSRINLPSNTELGDNFTLDNTTTAPDPGATTSNTNTAGTKTMGINPLQQTGSNTNYILIGAIVVVLALILARK